MREIKFRVWDKDLNMMSYSNDDLLVMFLGNDICVAYDNPAGDGEVKNYELMQYVGIKDISGKEVYVGDILEIPDDELYFEVNFDKSDLRYCATELVLKTSYDLSDFIVANDDCKDIINGFVVGNIYESPELLEEEHEN